MTKWIIVLFVCTLQISCKQKEIESALDFRTSIITDKNEYALRYSNVEYKDQIGPEKHRFRKVIIFQRELKGHIHPDFKDFVLEKISPMVVPAQLVQEIDSPQLGRRVNVEEIIAAQDRHTMGAMNAYKRRDWTPEMTKKLQSLVRNYNAFTTFLTVYRQEDYANNEDPIPIGAMRITVAPYGTLRRVKKDNPEPARKRFMKGHFGPFVSKYDPHIKPYADMKECKPSAGSEEFEFISRLNLFHKLPMESVGNSSMFRPFNLIRSVDVDENEVCHIGGGFIVEPGNFFVGGEDLLNHTEFKRVRQMLFFEFIKTLNNDFNLGKERQNFPIYTYNDLPGIYTRLGFVKTGQTFEEYGTKWYILVADSRGLTEKSLTEIGEDQTIFPNPFSMGLLKNIQRMPSGIGPNRDVAVSLKNKIYRGSSKDKIYSYRIQFQDPVLKITKISKDYVEYYDVHLEWEEEIGIAKLVSYSWDENQNFLKTQCGDLKVSKRKREITIQGCGLDLSKLRFQGVIENLQRP